MDFNTLNLPECLVQSTQRMGFDKPTPIQAAAIPPALEGKDIVGTASTGTGKTAAFVIPAIAYLIANEKKSALILTPTRELAKQVLEHAKELLGNAKLPIKTSFLIGGEPMQKQLQQLKQNPRLIVGTPGRINDHLERGSLKLGKTGYLVLDETDRMLDMGFGVQIDRILPHLEKPRQTLLFSATLPKAILKLADKYLTNPVRVEMAGINKIADTITQDVKHVDGHEKYAALMQEIETREGSIIVFARTKFSAEKMAKKLSDEGVKADSLHGGLKQSRRTKVMLRFREQKFRVLVATDVAARGLDVPHIQHVINYDLPQAAEDYIHRMGRTGRNGATGHALSFVSRDEKGKWHAIQRFLDPSVKQESFKDSKPKSSRGKPKFNGSNRPARNGDTARKKPTSRRFKESA